MGFFTSFQGGKLKEKTMNVHCLFGLLFTKIQDPPTDEYIEKAVREAREKRIKEQAERYEPHSHDDCSSTPEYKIYNSNNSYALYKGQDPSAIAQAFVTAVSIKGLETIVKKPDDTDNIYIYVEGNKSLLNEFNKDSNLQQLEQVTDLDMYSIRRILGASEPKFHYHH